MKSNKGINMIVSGGRIGVAFVYTPGSALALATEFKSVDSELATRLQETERIMQHVEKKR